jgi:hypothetical protein
MPAARQRYWDHSVGARISGAPADYRAAKQITATKMFTCPGTLSTIGTKAAATARKRPINPKNVVNDIALRSRRVIFTPIAWHDCGDWLFPLAACRLETGCLVCPSKWL